MGVVLSHKIGGYLLHSNKKTDAFTLGLPHITLILRKDLMKACFQLAWSSLAFFPTCSSRISPFLPLSSLCAFTNTLSSHASLSCFDITVKYSVHPEMFSIPCHCDLLGSLFGSPALASASQHSFVFLYLSSSPQHSPRSTIVEFSNLEIAKFSWLHPLRISWG